MKILFLIADNPYQTTIHFAKGFIRALERAGVNVCPLTVSSFNFQSVITKVFNERPDVTCSFSDFKMGEESLGNAWGLPHVSLLIDPAFYYSHHLKGKHSFVTTVDLEDAAWIGLKGKKALFFPHAVSGDEIPCVQKRLFDLVMIGSCQDPVEICESWKAKYSNEEVDFLKKAALEILYEEKSIGQVVSQSGFKTNGPQLFYELDRYISNVDRIELLHALKEFSIHIWGSGPWKKLVPHATCHRKLDYEKARTVMAQAKIVINTNLRFKSGSHERVFQSLLSKTSVVTPANAFFKSQFDEKEGVLFYRPGRWDRVGNEVKRLLGSEIQREEEACKGYEKVKHFHTWDTRAKPFLGWLKEELQKMS